MSATQSMMNILHRNPFEAEAREIIDEYRLDPTDQAVASLAMQLATREHQRQMQPYQQRFARLLAQTPRRMVYEPATHLAHFLPDPLYDDLAKTLQELSRSVAKDLGLTVHEEGGTTVVTLPGF